MKVGEDVSINNFDFYKVGTIFNPIQCKNAKPKGSKITVRYPSRINAMAIDPSKIVENNNMKYTPGEVIFSTRLFIEVQVKLIEEEKIIVSESISDRKTVAEHACLLMKAALGYKGGFEVQVKNYHNLKHCGLGSTGCLQAGIANAINHLFGCPLTAEEMVSYLAQNYGEEIDGNEEELNPVQCIGGSAASGTHKGGVLIVAGENTVIAAEDIPDDYQVVIGIPDSYEFIDSKSQFEDEKENLEKFMECGRQYRNEIAYNILHHFLPAMKTKDMKIMGDVIYDYRYNKGSIANCDYTYPGLVELFENLKFLKEEDYVDVLAISSVGPAIFAIGRDVEKCIETFKLNNLRIIETKINNDTYFVEDME